MLFSTQNIHLEKSLHYLISFSFYTIPKGNYLFGKNLQNFFPRARIRFIRYEGTEEKFGTEMNVIKDVIFEGTLLNMINEAITYLDTQVKEKTYLGPDGTFVTDEENAFMLQAVIYNSKVGKTIVEKTADSLKKWLLQSISR